jgi:hypothetical protein
LYPPEDTPLPASAKRYLQHLLQTIPSSRVLFIKQERKVASGLSLFVVVAREQEPIVHPITLASYEELPDVDLVSIVNSQKTSAGDRTLFLVCTDGKHDYCCAKFGLPIFKAMREVAGNAVWQASHVGGDRFAANVVCFPHGVFYGHVRPEDIQPLMEKYREGNIYLPKYRGRACYPFVTQAAEYFVRRDRDITGTDALQLRSAVREAEQIWRISFKSTDAWLYQVMVRRSLSEFENYLSCKAIEPERVPQYELLDLHVTKD